MLGVAADHDEAGRRQRRARRGEPPPVTDRKVLKKTLQKMITHLHWIRSLGLTYSMYRDPG